MEKGERADDEIEVAIAGDGVTLDSVPLAETLKLLAAMNSLVQAVAQEEGLPAPQLSLVAVRETSSAQALRAPGRNGVTRRVLSRTMHACKGRGRGHGPEVRAVLERLHAAGKTGHVRIRMGEGEDRISVDLAAPLPAHETVVAEERSTVHGKVVKIEAVRTGYRVALRFDYGGSAVFECDAEVAKAAGEIFDKPVRALVVRRIGDDESFGQLERIEPFEEVDFLTSMKSFRRRLVEQGRSLGGSELLRQLRDLRSES